MQEELSAYILEHDLFTKQDKLLLALSGGVDSMTLLHLMVDLGYDISVAHMNFRLRGNEADLDEIFVSESCNAFEIPVHTKGVETVSYARERQTSIQMAARELRYEWFDELCSSEGFDYIVTAHNADDNLETVLFNLTKGTGIRGLRGIGPKVERLVRPLLFATKSDILEYATANHIQWREDASNTDTKYLRNKIRHEVVPALKEINPSMITHFENTRIRMTGTEQVLLRRVDEIRKAHFRKEGGLIYIDQTWMEGQEADAVILSELLRDYGYTFLQCLDISKHKGLAGKLFRSRDYTLNADRYHFIVKPSVLNTEQSTNEIHSVNGDYSFGEWHLVMKEQPINEFQKDESPHQVFMDAAAVRFPLVLRPWAQGDTFQPLGMSGKKKISDFLIDQKIPLVEKSKVLVLESNKMICWVVNHRLDDRFKITDKTQKILKITLSKII